MAAAEPDRAPGRLVGRVPHDVHKLLKMLAKVGTAEQLHIVYEAGATGFGLRRALKAKGYSCEIIAPSQIPRRPGDRVKCEAGPRRIDEVLVTNGRTRQQQVRAASDAEDGTARVD